MRQASRDKVQELRAAAPDVAVIGGIIGYSGIKHGRKTKRVLPGIKQGVPANVDFDVMPKYLVSVDEKRLKQYLYLHNKFKNPELQRMSSRMVGEIRRLLRESGYPEFSFSAQRMNRLGYYLPKKHLVGLSTAPPKGRTWRALVLFHELHHAKLTRRMRTISPLVASLSLATPMGHLIQELYAIGGSLKSLYKVGGWKQVRSVLPVTGAQLLNLGKYAPSVLGVGLGYKVVADLASSKRLEGVRPAPLATVRDVGVLGGLHLLSKVARGPSSLKWGAALIPLWAAFGMQTSTERKGQRHPATAHFTRVITGGVLGSATGRVIRIAASRLKSLSSPRRVVILGALEGIGALGGAAFGWRTSRRASRNVKRREA